MAAAANVLNIPELLEAILVKLPIQDILLTKAVAPQWKQLIEEFIRLKKALFLAGNDPIQPIYPGEICMPRTAFEVHPLFSVHHDPSCNVEELQRDLQAAFQGEQPRGWRYTWSHARLFVVHGFSWDNQHIDLKEGLQLAGPARAMFLTQPPITSCRKYVRNVPTEGQVTIYNKDGITLGLVADTFAKIFRQLDQSPGTSEMPYPWLEWLDGFDHIAISLDFTMSPAEDRNSEELECTGRIRKRLIMDPDSAGTRIAYELCEWNT